jgi:lipopolysaccharide export system permease protein
MVLTFFIVLFVLLLQFLWMYIDELIGKGLSMGVIGEFMLWGMASFIPLALPLSTMLSSIMTMGNLGENNELLAMKAAGLSLQRIMRPLMILAVCISIGAFFIANDLIPFATLKINTLLYDIRQKREEIKIPAGIFYNGIEDVSLYVSKQDEKTNLMHHIMLYDHRDKRGNTTVTLADSGYIRLTENKQHILFTLYNGHTFEEGESRARDTTHPFQRRHFATQEVLIPLEGYGFQRSDGSRFQSDAQMQSIDRLSFLEDSLRGIIGLHRDKFLTTLGGTLQGFQRPDSATRARQVYTLSLDSLFNALPVEKQLELAQKAATYMERNNMHVNNYVSDHERDDYPRRRMAVEWHRKFTLSFACLIFFFIGAPLGAIIRKGGLGTPAVVSMFFFVVYWVIDISGKKLSRDGALEPMFGIWLSSFILLPIGIFLTYKATSDSSLFNADKYIAVFKAFFSRRKKNAAPPPAPATADADSRPTNTPLRIVYMGTPEFAVAPLMALHEAGYTVAGVVTVPDRPAGRGRHLQPSAVKTYALNHQLPLAQPEHLKDEAFLAQLRQWQADVFVVVAFRMLPEEVFALPPCGTFNLHASLLPQYRGAAPINRALMNGEKLTGLTTFFIDKKMDTGHIIFQETLPIGDNENAGQLYHRLMHHGAALVLKTLDAIGQGTAQPVPQAPIDPQQLRLAPKITRETREIDWHHSPQTLHNQVRGLSPYPAAVAELENTATGTRTPLKILATRYEDTPHNHPPGTLLPLHKDCLTVACAGGYLIITHLQPAGKKPMSAKEFLMGQPLLIQNSKFKIQNWLKRIID